MQLTGFGLTPADLGLPQQEFRQHQLEVIEQILNSTAKVIVMRAPTGSGKSLIAQVKQIIQADRCLILTKTKLLQEQYERAKIVALYGRSNYQCNRFPVVTSDQGICHLGQNCSLKFGGCDYYDQKNLAAAQPVAVLNYPYFFVEANGPGKFSHYDWIIADEGHSVPDQIANAYTIHINHSDARKMGLRLPKSRREIAAWIAWAAEYKKYIQTKAHYAQGDFIRIVARCKDATDKINNIYEPANWIIETDKFKTVLRPIWIEGLAQAYFWRHAQRFLLMSATINADYVLGQLGMAKSQTQFIDVPSTFPAKNRPIWVYAHHTIGFRATNLDILALIQSIDEIITRHGGRGLIHCSSYSLAKTIMDFSTHGKRLMGHTQSNRAYTLERFKEPTNNSKVLVSPSMTEGVDLPYELCEFQIIAKVPFPSRADPVWIARFANDKNRAENAYTLETISSLVQAYGRGMRAADDNCETYILDKNFLWLYNQYLNHFPPNFQDAVRVKDKI